MDLDRNRLSELDRSLPWCPTPGAQMQAFNSDADVVLYGGSAGSGKTDLALGKALTRHRRSLILRREYPQLRAIIERSHELYGPFGTFNATEGLWRLDFGGVKRTVEFGSCPLEQDKMKFQGRPHDLVVFDEASGFLESMVRLIAGWLRTEVPGQRCQLLLPTNPPLGGDGAWLRAWFRPWIDGDAKPGELRWFTTIDGQDAQVENGEPFLHRGERITPRSRTFIPGKLADNPYLMRTGYGDVLQALPEPLRSAMLNGDWNAGREDHAMQVVPRKWIELAMERWRAREKPATPLSAIGLDIARGGRDKTVLTLRHDNWIAQQVTEPGRETPDGGAVASLVMAHHKGDALVLLDVIGVGGSVLDRLKPVLKNRVVGLNGSESSGRRDQSGRLEFLNKRAEWWWTFREALDPETGMDLALPLDRGLLEDLCTPRWKISPGGKLQVESKPEIIARLGHSPDLGDSCVYALSGSGRTSDLDYLKVMASW